MLKDYLSVARDALRTQKELYHVKEQRLALALDEYVRLNDAYKEKSSSHTSCKSGVVLRLPRGDQPVADRRPLGPVEFHSGPVPSSAGRAGRAHRRLLRRARRPRPGSPSPLRGTLDPFCFCSSVRLVAFRLLLSPILPFQIKANNRALLLLLRTVCGGEDLPAAMS